MIGRSPSTASSIVSALPRVWWGTLIAIHAPIIVVLASSMVLDGPDVERLGSLFALLVAIAFFALKFRDVAFLRLRTNQQAFVAVCLVTAVVHHGALRIELDERSILPAAVIVATSTLAPAAIRLGRGGLRSWRRFFGTGIVRWPVVVTGRVQVVVALPGASWLGTTPVARRAPA